MKNADFSLGGHVNRHRFFCTRSSTNQTVAPIRRCPMNVSWLCRPSEACSWKARKLMFQVVSSIYLSSTRRTATPSSLLFIRLTSGSFFCGQALKFCSHLDHTSFVHPNQAVGNLCSLIFKAFTWMFHVGFLWFHFHLCRTNYFHSSKMF